jgi:MFS family permease
MPDDDRARGPAAQLGLGQAIADQLSLQSVIGGPRGLAESILPMTVFSVVWAFTHDVQKSVLAALVPAALFTIWRLVAREPVTQALGGLLGIGLGAGLALFTGRAQDFFVPGIVKNLAFGALYAISALVRYPLIGLLLGFTLGEELHWRKVPRRMRVYQQATWVWVGVFAVRALVQGRLYTQGDPTTLGFVNLVLGLPLFGVAVALTWLLVRRVPPARPDRDTPAGPEPVAAEAEEPAAEVEAAEEPEGELSGGGGRG